MNVTEVSFCEVKKHAFSPLEDGELWNFGETLQGRRDTSATLWYEVLDETSMGPLCDECGGVSVTSLGVHLGS